MKKILFILPIAMLLAAGCNNNQSSTYGQQQTPAPNTPANNSTATASPAMNTQAMPQNTQTTTNKTPAPKTQATTVSVVISNFAFSPAALTVKKGTKVTWTNKDNAPHTIIGDNGGPASGNLANGQSYSYTFSQTGTFNYHCSIHPFMTASVTVTE